MIVAMPSPLPVRRAALILSGSARMSGRKEEALQAAVSRLKAGGIVAVKGIGGFHLVCDARNDDAVALLRLRKHRPAKPLAVMLPGDDGLPEPARRLLTTPAAPIVLVQKRYVAALSEGIAPGLTEVGVMLPRIHCSICSYKR
jgi:hydrogenase maturation protein HypF